MSRKEVPRAGLLKMVLAGKATNAQGAAALRVSPRHVQRLKVRLQGEGAPGLLHRGRGRPSTRRLASTIAAQIDTLLQTRYKDFNDCHATEKLREVEGLRVSRELVRRRRRALGLPAKHRRRPRQYRHRRTPEARMGQLVQIDASPFAWLEARGPAMTLHGAIDDATSTVLALHFHPTEDLHGYAIVFPQMFTQYGRPLAIYGDRINILVRNDAHWSLAEQLRGAQDPTHLGRVRHDLGIGYLEAGSPEAKGRVERLWRTLQDRLSSELRLRHITTPEGANAFLPEFLEDLNPRFTRPPRDPAPPGASPRAISPASSAAATRARSLATTPSTSGPAGSSCRPALTTAPMPAAASNCASSSMAASSSSMRARSSPRNRRPSISSSSPAVPRARRATARPTAPILLRTPPPPITQPRSRLRINADPPRPGLPIPLNADFHGPRRTTPGAGPSPSTRKPSTR